jgi:hypothetical protein
VDIDEAIDGFLAALSRAGAPAPVVPTDLSALSDLERTIAPLRVPGAVRRFWQRVAPETLGIDTYPRLHGPEFALESWLMSREFGDADPPALLQIAYESHDCMSAELDQPDVAGGALFEWNLVDGDFERRFNGLEDWLTYLTELLAAGRFSVDETLPRGRVVIVPSPEDWEVEPRWRRPLPSHPLHGQATHVGRDILQWPEHWRRLTGLTPAHIQPRGASHTIAELTQTDPRSPIEATIVAKVVSLTGGGGGVTVRVDDGSGVLVVDCPIETTLLGPTIDTWFEFDVLLPAGPRSVPIDPDTAGVDERDPERRREAQFVARYAQPAGATATAVRRTKPPGT